MAASTTTWSTYDASGRITAIEGHAMGYQSFQIDPYWGKAVRIAGDQTVAYRYGTPVTICQLSGGVTLQSMGTDNFVPNGIMNLMYKIPRRW